MSSPAITLDLNKSVPLSAPAKGITLDLSKSEPIKESDTTPLDQPGALRRIAQAVGIPTSSEETAALIPKNAQELADFNPVGMVKKIIENQAKAMYSGFSEANTATEDIKRRYAAGELTKEQALAEAQKAATPALRAFPVLGPAMERMQRDIETQNVSGAVGSAVGIAGQVLAPELLEHGVPALAKSAPVQYIRDVAPQVAKLASQEILSRTPGINRIAGSNIKPTFGDLISAFQRDPQATLFRNTPKLGDSPMNTLQQLSSEPIEKYPATAAAIEKVIAKDSAPAGPTQPELLAAYQAAVKNQLGPNATSKAITSNVADLAEKDADLATDIRQFYAETQKSNLKANQRQLASPTGSTAPVPSPPSAPALRFSLANMKHY